MRILLFILVAVCVLSGCDSEPPSRATPRSAFSRLNPCVNNQDAACVYRELDRDSRWSIQTIFKTLEQMRQLVNDSYPKEMRGRAYGAWTEEAGAADDVNLFEIFCHKRSCLEKITAGFGAVTRAENIDDSLARITTTRDKSFTLARADGNWGLADFREELQKSKIRLLDRLEQVKENARDFEETRQAGGLSLPAKEK